MRLLVAISAHYVRAPDGCVYIGGPHRHESWKRCLAVFDEVFVLARVGRADSVEPRWVRTDGAGVSFCDLPDLTGVRAHLAGETKLKDNARLPRAGTHAFLIRSYGDSVSMLAWKQARRQGRPYGVEVVADPWNALRPGTVKGPFRTAGPTWSRTCSRRPGPSPPALQRMRESPFATEVAARIMAGLCRECLDR